MHQDVITKIIGCLNVHTPLWHKTTNIKNIIITIPHDRTIKKRKDNKVQVR